MQYFAPFMFNMKGAKYCIHFEEQQTRLQSLKTDILLKQPSVV